MSVSLCRTYPENAAMTDLITAELFATMAVRFWAARYRDPSVDGNRWLVGFAAADISDEGATAFNALMLIVATSTSRPLDIRCPTCLELGNDEASLLQMLGQLQRGCLTGAEFTLSGWMPAAAIRTALPFAATLAAAMAERGLRIPQRPPQDALRHRFMFPGAYIHYGASALALVH